MELTKRRGRLGEFFFLIFMPYIVSQKKDIQQKNWVFEDNFYTITDTVQWFKNVDVRFSDSTIGVDSCNVYVMELDDDTFSVENCTNTAYFKR